MAVDPIIKQKAEDIRHKIYGKEVRESLASGLETMSEDVVEVTDRQATVEEQFQAVLDETTGKDVISAPEIILARDGATTLGERLDEDKAEVTAQLAHIAIQVKSSGGDDTNAIIAACNTLQARGGGKLFLPDSVYNVKLPKGNNHVLGNPLITFENLNHIEISCSGVIRDLTTYNSTSIERASLFRFKTCNNIKVNVKIESQAPDLSKTGDNTEGLQFLLFEEGCTEIDIDVQAVGCRGVVCFNRDYTDPISYKSKNINARIKATNARYPYLGNDSGDNAKVNLDVDNCGRNFFIFGVNNCEINVNSKNQQITSLIKAYNGLGCEDIKVQYKDTETTQGNGNNTMLSLSWGDSNPATHRNINIDLNVKNPSVNGWGSTFKFTKQSNGVDGDTVGRGHILDGFTLTGYSYNAKGSHVSMSTGYFDLPDVQRGISIKKLALEGLRSAQFPLNCLEGNAIFENVVSDNNVYGSNGEKGKIVFIGCNADTFTNGVSSVDRHSYIDCRTRNNAMQNYDKNKNIINTITPDGIINQTATLGLTNSVKTSKLLIGDLTIPKEIFKLPNTTIGCFRLTYYMAYSFGSLTPSSRREVYGVKSWSSAIDSNGNWSLLQPINDDIIEKQKGVDPGILTINFKTGGIVEVSATNYNQPTSRGVFVLEVINMSNNNIEVI